MAGHARRRQRLPRRRERQRRPDRGRSTCPATTRRERSRSARSSAASATRSPSRTRAARVATISEEPVTILDGTIETVVVGNAYAATSRRPAVADGGGDRRRRRRRGRGDPTRRRCPGPGGPVDPAAAADAPARRARAGAPVPGLVAAQSAERRRPGRDAARHARADPGRRHRAVEDDGPQPRHATGRRRRRPRAPAGRPQAPQPHRPARVGVGGQHRHVRADAPGHLPPRHAGPGREGDGDARAGGCSSPGSYKSVIQASQPDAREQHHQQRRDGRRGRDEPRRRRCASRSTRPPSRAPASASRYRVSVRAPLREVSAVQLCHRPARGLLVLSAPGTYTSHGRLCIDVTRLRAGHTRAFSVHAVASAQYAGPPRPAAGDGRLAQPRPPGPRRLARRGSSTSSPAGWGERVARWRRTVHADLAIRLTPRADRDRLIAPDAAGGALRARVTAPPVDGQANAALVKLVAKALGVPKSRVIPWSAGSTARDKVVRVDGLSAADAHARLSQALSALGDRRLAHRAGRQGVQERVGDLLVAGDLELGARRVRARGPRPTPAPGRRCGRRPRAPNAPPGRRDRRRVVST